MSRVSFTRKSSVIVLSIILSLFLILLLAFAIGTAAGSAKVIAEPTASPPGVRLLWTGGMRSVATPKPTPAPRRATLRAPTRFPRSDSPDVAPAPAGSYKALGQAMAAKRGWVGAEWSALDQLWDHESGWDPSNYGPWVNGVRACGIPQRYPCSGLDVMSPTAQIDWGLRYIAERYGSPSVAWGGWYGRGRSY